MFASKIDFLRMEPKPFGFYRTEETNNQIEQGDAFFFARNLIGVTYKQLTAMLTDAIHTFSHIASFGPSIYFMLTARDCCPVIDNFQKKTDSQKNRFG